jgi:hypothetical protein
MNRIFPPLLVVFISILAIFFSFSNEQRDSFTIIDITTGSNDLYPIIDGPREPPAFYPDLREFFEIDYPNAEFERVFIARTDNNPADLEEGYEFEEGYIWALFLSNLSSNETACEAGDERKKRIIDTISRRLGNPDRSSVVGTEILVKGGISVQYTCESLRDEVLVVRDYNVLSDYGNDKAKDLIREMILRSDSAKNRTL